MRRRWGKGCEWRWFEASEFFDRIVIGINQALAFAKGDAAGCIVHGFEADGTPTVATIRARTGLPQAEFARSIGVWKASLLNWDRGSASRTARVLLALIAKEPGIVQRRLGEG